MSSAHVVLGVLGASGGLGASTLAASLAAAFVPTVGFTCCVDGDLVGGGLDVTACLEHSPGLRWPDLAGLRGQIDGAELLGALPSAEGIHVLSAGRGAAAPPEVVRTVVRALRRCCALTVLDLPRSGPYAGLLARECGAVLLLSGSSARHLADALAVSAGEVSSCPEVWLAVRGDGRHDEVAQALAGHLDLPLAGSWRHSGRIAADAERGRPPGSRGGQPLRSLAEPVLAAARAAAGPAALRELAS